MALFVINIGLLIILLILYFSFAKEVERNSFGLGGVFFSSICILFYFPIIVSVVNLGSYIFLYGFHIHALWTLTPLLLVGVIPFIGFMDNVSQIRFNKKHSPNVFIPIREVLSKSGLKEGIHYVVSTNLYKEINRLNYHVDVKFNERNPTLNYDSLKKEIYLRINERTPEAFSVIYFKYADKKTSRH